MNTPEFVIRLNKTGREIRVKSSEFKKDTETGLPIAHLGYGVDASTPINKNNPEAMFYPNVVGKGKMRISFQLPYHCYNPSAYDTKTGREFTIKRRKTDRNCIEDGLFPIFSIIHNEKEVGLLRGEEYNKD